ncbi:MAG: lysoplasmalogenase [Lysobacterales bacterium]
MKPDWRILYAISAVAVLAGLLFGLPVLYMSAKPLLMITLLLYFASATKGYPRWRFYVMAALVFSWAGDVFLISSEWFIAGLVSFLIAHIFYIIAYQKTGAATGELKTLDVVKFVAYGVVLIWVIYPGLDDLLIPVLIYALVLLAMGVWAHKRRGATSSDSFQLVAIGAILFALSDGLIAINKFAFEVPFERILIMSIYMTAQYLIVQGLIKHTERT